MPKLAKQMPSPKLRFPQFIKQPLREIQLKDVTAESTTRNGNKLPTTSVMGVKKNEGIVPMEERIIASDIARYKIVQRDWFAYNPMRLNIGSIAQWQGENDILVSPDYVVFKCLDKSRTAIDPSYLNHFRQSDAWEKFVTEGGDGSVRVRIYYKDLARLQLVLPPVTEQQKVAECLTSLDEVIVAQGRKVEVLNAHKRGLMQQLFPREGETCPRLRFSEFLDTPEWEEAPLKSLASYQNGKAYEQEIVEEGRFVVVNSRFVSTDGTVRKHTNAEYCTAMRGDVLMVLSDLPNGRALARCFLVDTDDRYAVNQRVARLTPTDVQSVFLFYRLNRSPRLLKFDDGLTQTHLSKGDVQDCLLCVPREQQEQQRIADCLSSLDAQIAAETDQLAVLKTHKQGLMQQLFPAPEGAGA